MEHYFVAVYHTTHSIKQEGVLWAFAASEMKLFVDLWWHRDWRFSPPTFFRVIRENSFPFTVCHLIHAVWKFAQNLFSRRGWSILETQGEETGPQKKFSYAAAFMCFEEIVKMMPWFSWDEGPAFECLVDVSSISPVLFSYRWTELNDYMWRAFFFLTKHILLSLSW